MSERINPRENEVRNRYQEPIPLGYDSLVGQYSPDSFRNEVENRGLEVLQDERKEGEDHQLVVRVEPGSYQVDTGFERFNLSDKRFYYGNNPVELQHIPLELDYESQEFRQFERMVQATAEVDLDNLSELIHRIDSVLQREIESSGETDNIRRMSEILRSHKSACAGKSVVSGALLEHLYGKNLSVQRVHGVSYKMGDSRGNDVGHDWLRITNGNKIVLYDPYFRRQESHLYSDSEKEDSSFKDYEIEAGFIARINTTSPIDIESLEGVRLVRNIHGSFELFADREQAYKSQISGRLISKFLTQGGNMQFINGSFQLARSHEKEASRMLIPLIDIKRV